jgi:hypothetical protein
VEEIGIPPARSSPRPAGGIGAAPSIAPTLNGAALKSSGALGMIEYQILDPEWDEPPTWLPMGCFRAGALGDLVHNHGGEIRSAHIGPRIKSNPQSESDYWQDYYSELEHIKPEPVREPEPEPEPVRVPVRVPSPPHHVTPTDNVTAAEWAAMFGTYERPAL